MREIPGQARNEEWKGPVLRQAQQPGHRPALRQAQGPARNAKGSEIDVSPTPHTRSFRPCQVGALGVDGDIGIGGGGMGVDSEAVLGVRGDLPVGDGFYGSVPAGYGGVDPDWGRGGAQDGI